MSQRKGKTAAESMDWFEVTQRTPPLPSKVARNYALAYALRAAFDRYLASPQFKEDSKTIPSCASHRLSRIVMRLVRKHK